MTFRERMKWPEVEALIEHFLGKDYRETTKKYPVTFREPVYMAAMELYSNMRFREAPASFWGRIRNKIGNLVLGISALGISSFSFSGDNVIAYAVFGGRFKLNGKEIEAAVIISSGDVYDSVTVYTSTQAPGFWGRIQKVTKVKVDDPSPIFNVFDSYVGEKNPLRGKAIDIYGRKGSFEDYDWDDIAIPEYFKKEVEENIIWPVKYRDKIKAAKISLSRGLLLEGERGMGKTLLSMIIANKVKGYGTFIKARPTDIIKLGWSYIFEVAKNLQSSVLYIEDFESLAPSEKTPTVSAFLTDLLDFLDGTEERGDVTILTSTNVPEIVDMRVIDRPGRIDRRLIFNPKDKENFGLEWKEQVLKIHLRGHKLKEGLTTKHLAKIIENLSYTGSHIKELIHTAKLEALRRVGIENLTEDEINSIILTEEDFKKANERIGKSLKQ